MESLTEASAEHELVQNFSTEEKIVKNRFDEDIEILMEVGVEVDLMEGTPAEKLIVKTHLVAAMKSLAEASAKVNLEIPESRSIADALESLTEAMAGIKLLQENSTTTNLVEASLNAAINCGQSSNSPLAKPPREGIPINIMNFPREIRDKIYPYVFGGYHIHVRNLNAGTNGFRMESMNGLLIDSLRFHLDSAEAGLVSNRAPFGCGYWPANELYHCICQQANDSFPTYECSGICLNLGRNRSTLSLASLRTCRVVYEEARLIPYSLNSFEFSESNVLDFLRTRVPDQISAMKIVKFVASMERRRRNEGLTQWVSGILQQTCLLKNLTSIMFSAKYVAVDGGQLWADGYLITTPRGLCCQVVLGQEEPGVGRFWWTRLQFEGELVILRLTPDSIQDQPPFVNLLPSAHISLVP